MCDCYGCNPETEYGFRVHLEGYEEYETWIVATSLHSAVQELLERDRHLDYFVLLGQREVVKPECGDCNDTH